MKLARFESGGAPGWAVVDTQTNSLRAIAGGVWDWGRALAHGEGEGALSFVGSTLLLADVRLLAPFERTSKIIVVGANYRKHLKDFNLAAPVAPHIFMKPSGALIGAREDILYSPLSQKFDFEVELVAVFGEAIPAGGDPYKSILGYTVGNDVSARDLQPGTPGIGMDLLSAKGLDRTCPLGPWIVTRDEFGDCTPDLSMTTIVNGEVRQNGRSSEMTWNVGELAAFVDARTRFEPGDIMFTGTPEGVGQGDGRFLSDGDLIESTIERIGTLRNVLRRPPPSSVERSQ